MNWADNKTLPIEGEQIRAVIWDLDETFWRGTITEGGIEQYSASSEQLVITLAKRGIVSSICSNNDFQKVKAILTARGVWDYFIFPNINWSPKGPRVTQIVNSLQLRAETVLFIDDNPHNLAAAVSNTPGLLVASEDVIPQLLDHPRLHGKDDAGMTRLYQYQLLSQRRLDKQKLNIDPTSFLRSCAIAVTIEYDVAAHLERAVELVNRTNQLNFTKRRLPSDVEEAKRNLREEISDHSAWAGLVRVKDRYGDYGFVGFFLGMHNNKHKQLLHFCFSCRTIGMGIETWVYRSLGSPPVQIVGDVQADIMSNDAIDWINISASPELSTGAAYQLSEVRVRGGCELEAVSHYFGTKVNLYSETNYRANGNGLFVRRDGVFNAATFLTNLNQEVRTDLLQMGIDAEFFATRTFDPAPLGALVVLDFWADAYLAHFRHRKSGSLFGFSLEVRNLRDLAALLTNNPSADITSFLDDINPGAVGRRQAIERVLRGLVAHFELIGVIGADAFESALRTVLTSTPVGARVAIINFPTRSQKDGQVGCSPRVLDLREATQRAAADFGFVRIIEIENSILDTSESQPGWHFDRIVYYRIYQQLQRELDLSAEREWSARAP